MTISLTIPSWNDEPYGWSFWLSFFLTLLGVTAWMAAAHYDVPGADKEWIKMGYSMGGTMGLYFFCYTIAYLVGSQPAYQRWNEKEIAKLIAEMKEDQKRRINS